MQVPGPEEAVPVSSVDTVVRKCTGFKCLVGTGFVFRPVLLGLAFLLSGLFPRVAILLLLRKCSLESADFVNVKLRDGTHHLLKVRRLSTQPRFIQSKVRIASKKKQFHRVFRLSTQLYIFQPDLSAFLPLDDMPSNLPQQLWLAVTALKDIDNGADWSTFNVPAAWPRMERSKLYGNNDLNLAQPFFLPTLLQTVSWVLYLIQYAEFVVSLWHGRVVVSGILVFITLLSCGRTSLRTYNTRRMLAAKVRKHSYKVDYHLASAKYHPDTHQTCTIFAGTVVHQVWNEEDPDDVVLAMVARTGVNSTIGSMLRKALRPANYLESSDSLVRDILGIYCFALVVSVGMFLTTVGAKSHELRYRGSPGARLLDAVVAGAPLGAPAMIVFAVTVTVVRLKAQGIAVLYPRQLKLAAMVDIACFDKTGTLTGSEEGFYGMLPVKHLAFGPLSKFGMHWSRNLKFAAAVCNGLVMKGKTGYIGDTLEKSLFAAVEAQFLAHNTVTLPYRTARSDSSYLVKLHVLKRYEFTSQSMKSGAIAIAQDESEDCAILFLKGAPAVIQHIADPGTVPANFAKVVDDWTSQGFRLLALAAGTIKHISKHDAGSMSLQQAEAAVKHISLLGIIVVTNQLRPDSRDTIHELQDEGGIRTAMITGDYHQTAVSVAWAVGMVPPGGVVHIIDKVARARKSVVSPPTSPVQVASSSMLFPRSGEVRPPYSRYPSITSSNLSPRTPKPNQFGDRVVHSFDSPGLDKTLLASRMQRLETQAAPPAHRGFSLQLDQPKSAPPISVASVARQPTLSALQLPEMIDPPGLQTSVTEDPQHFRLQCEGLKFTLGFGDVREDTEAINAMTSIAAGEAQCAVTGAAFEHLLQQEDLSVLNAVLQNAVVFARMRPHQKAQVLSLLGQAGLHQVFQGRHRHIPGLGQTVAFCGDGLNDLAALVTAEVGFAIGPIEAMVAAPISTRRSSIAGFATFIKEARGSLVKIVALIKYMVIYQLVEFMATCVVFTQKGVFISQLQLGMIDLQALAWAFAASLTPVPAQLSPTKPTSRLCSRPIIVPILECLVGAAVLQACCVVLMRTELHVAAGSTFSTAKNPVVTLAWTVANFVLQGQVAGFRVDTYPHCAGLSTNAFLIIASVIIVIFAHACVFAGPWLTRQPLQLFPFPLDFRLRFYGVLLGAAGLFFMARFIKWYVNFLHQRQMRTLLRATGGSRQLSSTRNSLGSGEVAQPFRLSLVHFMTKLTSLNLRSPRIYPDPVEMSTASGASRSQPKAVVQWPPLQTYSSHTLDAASGKKDSHRIDRSEV